MVREGDAVLTRVAERACAALLGVAMLASCGTPGAGGRAADGSVRFIVGADAPTLNSMINDSPVTALVDEFVMSYLLRADPQGRPIPDLALQVPSLANGGLSRDGRTITYRLRRGVRWHDGAPFSANDVVFSFALARDPRTNVPDRSEYDNVAAVRAADPNTVVVTLRHPSASAIPTFFATTANDPYPVLPRHARELARDPNRANFNGAPIGTGPFVFSQWRRGDRVILLANPHYYGGPPAIPRLDVVTIPDHGSFELALRSGAADVAYEEVDDGAAPYDAASFAARAAPANDAEFLLFNVARGPLRDEALRAALVRGIDVPKLAAQLLPPGAARLTASDRLPGSPGYDPTLAHPPYDAKAAATLLDRAGYAVRGPTRTAPGGEPLSLELVTYANPSTVRIATLVQAQLRALGIAASIHTYPYALFYDSYGDGGVMTRGRFDLAITGWSYNGVDDRSYLYACDARPPNGENYGGICDPEIERERTLARTSVDPQVQARANAAISRRIVERSYLDMLWFVSYRIIARKGLEGPQATRLLQPAWNAAAWRWNDGAQPHGGR